MNTVAEGNVPLNRYYLDSFVIQPLSTAVGPDADDPRRGSGVAEQSTALLTPSGLEGNATGVGGQIKNLVHAWSISESIKTGSVRGSAKIYDSVGIFYTLPIKGQEKVTITYRDFEGIEREDQYIVYAVTEPKPSKQFDDSTLEYTIHFTSIGKFISDRFRVRRCISNGAGNYIPIADQAKILYLDYYRDTKSGLINDKDLFTTETQAPAQIVIPNMTPEESMHLLSRNAYSHDENMKSQMFRFFENRDSFFFVNMEDMHTGINYPNDKSFYYSSSDTNIGDVSEEDYLKRRQNIISLHWNGVNTLESVKGGAYSRRVNEADVFDRNEIKTDYKYYDEYKNYTHTDWPKTPTPHHDEDFVNKHLDYPATDYIIKDYLDSQQQNAPGFRPYPFYNEIFTNKKAMNWHYAHDKLIITINGYNDIVAGRMLQLDLPIFSAGSPERDAARNGLWLVEEVINEFWEQTYTQVLTLSKAGTL